MNGLIPHALVNGQEGVFTIPAFTFENGAQFHNLKVGYVTHGMLNAPKDNAILLVPGTANNRHSADGYIGAGQALDPNRHFIIATDAIGAGTSSQPGDGLGSSFPHYTIRDMVRAAHLLVTQAFGVAHLKAVVGASMGAFQALEWSIHYPDAVERVVLMVPAARAGNVFRSVVHTMIEVIRLDPVWTGEQYATQPLAGLRASGRLYFPWTVTDTYLETLAPDQLEHEIQGTVARAAAWDAWTLIRRYQASAAHDIAAPFDGDLVKALSHVRARVLVMPTTTDRLLGLASARDIAKHATNAAYAEVPSERGHLGWRAVPGASETSLITARIKEFLR